MHVRKDTDERQRVTLYYTRGVCFLISDFLAVTNCFLVFLFFFAIFHCLSSYIYLLRLRYLLEEIFLYFLKRSFQGHFFQN